MLACDGIFDKLSNEECIECVWNTVRQLENPDVHESLGAGVECVMKNALN